MAAALRAAEGGGYIFSKSSGGVFSKFFRPGGGYPPYPPYSRPLLNTHLHFRAVDNNAKKLVSQLLLTTVNYKQQRIIQCSHYLTVVLN